MPVDPHRGNIALMEQTAVKRCSCFLQRNVLLSVWRMIIVKGILLIYKNMLRMEIRRSTKRTQPSPLHELRQWLGALPPWLTSSSSNDHIWFPQLHHRSI